MRIRRKLLILTLSVISTCLTVMFFSRWYDPVPLVTIKLVPSSAFIGDEISRTVKITFSGRTEVRPTLDSDTPDGMEVTFSETETTSFAGIRTRVIRTGYTSFTPGKYVFGPIGISYRDPPQEGWKTLTVPGNTIFINKLLKDRPRYKGRVLIEENVTGPRGTVTGDTPSGPAADIDTPVRFYINDKIELRQPLTYEDILLFSGTSGAILLLLVFFFFFIKSAARHFIRERRPSLRARTLKKLGRLERRGLQSGKEKEFCSELSEILMDFSRRSFALGRYSMTSYEFSQKIAFVPQLSDEERSFLSDRLVQCERVRYSSEPERSFNIAPNLELEKDFVKKITEKLGEKGRDAL